MTIKIDLKGFKKGKFDRLKSLIDEEVTDTLKDEGGDWIADTKENTPVDTGDLRRSWTLTEPEKHGRFIEMELSNNLEYALIMWGI